MAIALPAVAADLPLINTFEVAFNVPVTCASEYVFKINSIIISNIDGTNAADVTVYFYDAGSTNRFQIVNTVSVPADSTLVVLDKNSAIYLEEGDKIEGLASAASDLQMIVSYEAITD